MKLRGKFTVFLLGLTFVFASAHIADAGWSEGMGGSTVLHTDRAASGNDRDVTPSGALRVDRDLYALHPDDTNQFGDDEAYNTLGGHCLVPVPFHREH